MRLEVLSRKFAKTIINTASMVKWNLATLLIDKNRTFEVFFGKAKYCFDIFKREMNEENCKEAFYALNNVASPISPIISKHGHIEAYEIQKSIFDIIHSVHHYFVDLNKVNCQERKNALMHAAWHKMRTQLFAILNQEKESSMAGSDLYYHKLVIGDYAFDDKRLRSYPILKI